MKGKKSKKPIPPLEGFYQPYDPPGYIPQSGPPQHSQFVHPGSVPALNGQQQQHQQQYSAYMQHYYNQGAPAAPNPFTQPQPHNAQHSQSHPPPQYRLPNSIQPYPPPHPSSSAQPSSSTALNSQLTSYNPYAKHVYHPNPPYNQIGIRQYLEEETHFECAECDSRRKDDKRAAWCDKCGKFTRTIKVSGP